MTSLTAFIRNNKYEIITLFVDIVLIVIACLTLPQTLIFFGSFFVLLFSSFFIIYIKTKERMFFYYPFNKPEQGFDWVGRGDFKFVRNEKCFEITRSGVGFILPKTSNWDDYTYKLEFKILRKSLGIIVRADNLSNYLMYQIFENKIRAHIRINGSWIVIGEDPLDNNFLSLDNWYKLTLTSDKRKIRIQINGKNQIIADRYFIIPDSIVLEKEQVVDTINKTPNKIKFVQNIDFDFGALGLRNHGDERALIKNLLVEKL